MSSFFSKLGKLRSSLSTGYEIAQLALVALELIGELTKKRPSLDTLDVIGNIYDRFKDAIDGKATPSEIRAELEKMREGLASNDAAADAAADAKFGDGATD